MDLIASYQNMMGEILDDTPFSQHKPTDLYAPCDYILGIGGKRLRPVLTLLGTDVFGGNVELALRPALAIEYFHNFTLMHDDIMDEAPLRRGKKTVHLKYGTNTAILSGDVLLIQSYAQFAELPPKQYKEVIQLFTQTAIEICEGQQLDMNFETQEHVEFEDYIEMIRLKTSVLIGTALEIGAIIADAEEKDRKNLYNFGVNLGIAFQLKDDYLDVFGQKEFGKIHAGDIIENKKTALYIQALKVADEESKKELEDWYSSKTSNADEKIQAVESIFRKLKVDENVMELINDFTQKGLADLEAIQISDQKKNILKDFAISLIDRQI